MRARYLLIGGLLLIAGGAVALNATDRHVSDLASAALWWTSGDVFNESQFPELETRVEAEADEASSDSALLWTAREQRPNIIIIYSDDQSFTELGYYNKNVYTPNIDRLFKGGLTFTNARVTTSLCTPSRYGLHTGTPASTGLDRVPESSIKNVQFNMQVRQDTPTIGKHLQSLGYRTGFVGKWHLGGITIQDRPADGQSISQEALRAAHNPDAEAIRVRGGFDFVAGHYMNNPAILAERFGLSTDLINHNPEWVTKGALDFIEEASGTDTGEPFFLMMAPTLVHTPTPELDFDLRNTPYGALPEAPSVLPTRHSLANRVSDHLDHQGLNFVRRSDRNRLRSIGLLDDSVGAVLSLLEEKQVADNTIIFFMSDNSDAKGSIYDDGLRVPLAVYWPGVIDPRTSNNLATNLDIFPTLTKLLGSDGDATWDGQSLFQNEGSDQTRGRQSPFFAEVGFARSIITADGWQYVSLRFPKSILDAASSEEKIDHQGNIGLSRWGIERAHPHYFDKDQLYDLRTDPMATENLVDAAEHANRLRQMKELLRQKLLPNQRAYAELL